MNDFKVFTTLAAFCACGVLAAPAGHQQQQQPVPILKQLNRQNEDGSYSYGYESADGTFKIETKYPTGEVYGKYGYVDETGKLRTVEYGASSRGFEPVGTGITVPPPVLAGDSNDLHGNRMQGQDDYDDGQYREDPSVYYRSEQRQQQQQQQQVPAARQQQQWYGGQRQQQQQQQQTRYDSRQSSHPAVRDFDPSSGSFSVSYTG